MALAALIVSILALILSGGAVWYTRRQAITTAKQARIEAERRRDELAPKWTAIFTRDSKRPRILLTNNGPTDARAAKFRSSATTRIRALFEVSNHRVRIAPMKLTLATFALEARQPSSSARIGRKKAERYVCVSMQPTPKAASTSNSFGATCGATPASITHKDDSCVPTIRHRHSWWTPQWLQPPSDHNQQRTQSPSWRSSRPRHDVRR